jgi:hypothetical protein
MSKCSLGFGRLSQSGRPRGKSGRKNQQCYASFGVPSAGKSVRDFEGGNDLLCCLSSWCLLLHMRTGTYQLRNSARSPGRCVPRLALVTMLAIADALGCFSSNGKRQFKKELILVKSVGAGSVPRLCMQMHTYFFGQSVRSPGWLRAFLFARCGAFSGSCMVAPSVVSPGLYTILARLPRTAVRGGVAQVWPSRPIRHKTLESPLPAYETVRAPLSVLLSSEMLFCLFDVALGCRTVRR